MVERHIRGRGIRDPHVLSAMATARREALVPAELAHLAYEDRPLPIGSGQTISQPYIVALMTEALKLRPGDRVLEIGTGSGYAAAVLAEIAGHVYTIERHAALADTARTRLAELGYTNIEVRCGDGTLGWPEHAPFDAIIVAAGGPEAPRALIDQLAIGGRLVIPLGPAHLQELVRITRVGPAEVTREDLGGVRFVPLIGEQGWREPARSTQRRALRPSVWPAREPLAVVPPTARPGTVARLIRECAEPIARIDDAPLGALVDRIGDSRVVLLGEATHGTAEFYRMRTRITQELVLRHGFGIVAVEADWPDAAVLDRYARALPRRVPQWTPFARFPSWMWRNRETVALIEWLRAYNEENAAPERKVRFAGLDLYSMYTSAYEVIRYLDRVDPVAAATARARYGALAPWQADPAGYGRAALIGQMRSAEDAVVAMLRELLARRLEYAARDGDDFFDAARNASVVKGAEAYYRAMYYGPTVSWNLRDSHMFDTLEALLAHRGPDAKIIVWEHNSHVGDAAATEMGLRGEHNVGHLCRDRFGDGAFIVGFGTDRGVVAAAHGWDEPMRRMAVRPAHTGSYERLCHDTGVPAFLLHLRDPSRTALRDELAEPRLERAIGVVYRPDTEMESHYFEAVLPDQFDEYVWFDETDAVTPIAEAGAIDVAATHPFAP